MGGFLYLPDIEFSKCVKIGVRLREVPNLVLGVRGFSQKLPQCSLVSSTKIFDDGFENLFGAVAAPIPAASLKAFDIFFISKRFDGFSSGIIERFEEVRSSNQQ